MSVEFDIGFNRYGVSGRILSLPEEQETLTYEQKMMLAQAEVFAIVDDIMDKGGMPPASDA